MTTVFELGGDLVKPEVANNLMRLIAEGTGEDDDADEELRSEAVETYLELLDKPALSNVLQQVRFQRTPYACCLSTVLCLCAVGSN